MAEQLFKEMGMKVIMLEVHPSAGGEWWYSTHDFTGEFGPNAIQSFSDRYPKEVEDMEKWLNRYLQYQDGFATGRIKMKVPWASIKNNQHNFIQKKYLLKDFELVEPSDMKQEDVSRLLKFWWDRQSKFSPGEVFHFQKVTTSACDPTLIPARYTTLQRKKTKPTPTDLEPRWDNSDSNSGSESESSSTSGTEEGEEKREAELDGEAELDRDAELAGDTEPAGDVEPARVRHPDTSSPARNIGVSGCGLHLPGEDEVPESFCNEDLGDLWVDTCAADHIPAFAGISTFNQNLLLLSPSVNLLTQSHAVNT
ncbi:unnamed protein product [Cyclocybe aegerita]|uniref:Uncharacterized protein n=1 Tax=Cyclocybe aegerita TaxID=1973307 RepID=A0A8S0W3Z6_CYCAE|nr:unnamed protein product [Cyclocybe aegerita]